MINKQKIENSLQELDEAIDKFNDIIIKLIESKDLHVSILHGFVEIRKSLFQISDFIMDNFCPNETYSEEYINAVKELFED